MQVIIPGIKVSKVLLQDKIWSIAVASILDIQNNMAFLCSEAATRGVL